MKQYGLIGYPLGHSFSKKYFTEKFQREGISGVSYETFPIPSIRDLPALLKEQPTLAGFNVTIPYKEQVTGFLDGASEVVRQTGACNCVKIENGKLFGHNTDVIGFERSLVKSFPQLPTHALVLGTGGAAKAVVWVLQKLKIDFKYVSRKPAAYNLSYEQLNAEVLQQHQLIINTTPLGMFPQVVEAPPIPYEALTPQHCLFDLIYNPATTLFMQKGLDKGARVQNGLDMLVIQAEESWAIWNA